MSMGRCRLPGCVLFCRCRRVGRRDDEDEGGAGAVRS